MRPAWKGERPRLESRVTAIVEVGDPTKTQQLGELTCVSKSWTLVLSSLAKGPGAYSWRTVGVPHCSKLRIWGSRATWRSGGQLLHFWMGTPGPSGDLAGNPWTGTPGLSGGLAGILWTETPGPPS